MNVSQKPETLNVEEASLLSEINKETALVLAPVLGYIAVLMALGLPGKTMVCYYYGFKIRKSSNSFFITILAVFDITVCLISMPTEISDIIFFYEFKSDIACKVLRFVNHFAAVGSGFTLLAIAIDRFRKICRPTKPQISLRNAKVISAVVVIIAVLLSWPAFIIYKTVKVSVANEYGTELSGSDCTTTPEQNMKTLALAFNGIHVSLLVLFTTILVVLYSLIARRIFMQQTFRKRTAVATEQGPSGITPAIELPSANSVSSTFISLHSSCQEIDGHNRSSALKHAPSLGGNTHIVQVATESCSRSKLSSNKGKHGATAGEPETRRGPEIPSAAQFNNEAIKLTFVMILVTIFYVVSFLPCLSLLILRAMQAIQEHDVISGAEGWFVVYEIGFRSFLVNSSVNPWIYGIFSPGFRHFFFKMLCKKCFKNCGKYATTTCY